MQLCSRGQTEDLNRGCREPHPHMGSRAGPSDSALLSTLRRGRRYTKKDGRLADWCLEKPEFVRIPMLPVYGNSNFEDKGD